MHCVSVINIYAGVDQNRRNLHENSDYLTYHNANKESWRGASEKLNQDYPINGCYPGDFIYGNDCTLNREEWMQPTALRKIDSLPMYPPSSMLSWPNRNSGNLQAT